MNDSANSEDLYTKIALDNKLVTQFQVKQACKEQDELGRDGQRLDLGMVLVRLGFLTERQNQSVLNACRYREQRDYDKRFGRQVMRMELLEQKVLEKALAEQKDGYSQTGQVVALADLLVEKDYLEAEKVESVHRGIRERDRARRQARHKGELVVSGKNAVLGVSGPTPVLRKKNEDDDLDDDISDLDDIDLDDDDDISDLDDIDLDDDDDDDISDLDDIDLEDDDDDDEDLDDVDLDEDLDGLDDLDDVDLQSDEDVDDLDLDDVDLGSVEDLDDEELAKAKAKDIDLDEGPGGMSSALRGLDDDAGLDDDDIGDINLDDLDEEALSADDDEDEADLATTVSELGSDVELDDEDLKALDEMDSGEEIEAPGAEWAADAFDDRPLHQRPPSDRHPVSTSASPPSPPSAPPLPKPLELPKDPPRVPAAAGSDRLRRAEAETMIDDSGIPGGDVFEGNLSDMGRVEDHAPTDAMNALQEVGTAAPAAGGPDPLMESAQQLIEELEKSDQAGMESEERRSLIESAVTDAFQRASDRMRESGRLRAQEAPPPPPTPSDLGAVEETPEPTPAPPSAPEPEPEPAPAPSPVASGLAALPRDLSQDPRVQQAFQKAMQAAWEVFKGELDEA